MSTHQPPTPNNRRPLKVRQVNLVQKIAIFLANKSITPNQISVLSVFFAMGAAVALVSTTFVQGVVQFVWYVLSALFIQMRLLCNLFDGLVAVEGGKSTLSGELFNDIPDRISDPVIIIAAGYAVVCVGYASELGWLGALLAVLTAYIRTLAVSIQAPANFTGPMAKQQRMALLTGAIILTALEQYFYQHDYVMLIALIVLNVGCVITACRRAYAAYCYLEQKTQ
ncbi:CDP-alcohol phosphatidyltransferase family protein [Acinetobacter sp. MD2(2019)]|uniref:CDP-alcohol phosphatidyltransferase family protein n=1 Tax=Acinetobacter sp. MD2(2019) TaxID=2605273 RepID=UPI002D1EB8F8|nr:CDP-alcohol phosphatidyltransferase family protein [Acinetobacter sp. MD2(2019)]MEB3752818.1 CDP-alcohol phosphatidyltransferase family protein [Acinetobacter sp. MD2(2019)]